MKNIHNVETQPPAAAAESVRVGPLVFHIGRAELRGGEEVIHLTDRERDMLRMLAAAPGETVTRLALAGNGASAGQRAVDVQVNRLRRKIDAHPPHPLLAHTVRRLRPPPLGPTSPPPPPRPP